MKHTSSLLLAAAAGLAAAQSPVIVKILVPNVDSQPIDASVVSAGPTATSYFLACPTDLSDEDCGLGAGFGVLYGPSTMSYQMTFSDTYTASAACKLDPAKNVADCTGGFVEGKSTSTISEVMTGYSSYIFPVTVTAGAEKLSGVAGSSSDGGASTTLSSPATTESSAGSSSATGTTLSTSAVPTNSGTGTGSGSTAPTSSSSTGGMPRITQNAVIMGAAALVGGAMLI